MTSGDFLDRIVAAGDDVADDDSEIWSDWLR
jgi:hypothetical protein